ncbi:MAG: DUF4416 family protein [Nitrospirae bacterium]|nr:DUF4416 family protein [Nitrospirota bacterium]
MGKIVGPHPVKLFIGMLSQDMSLIDQLSDDLCHIFGPMDLVSPVLPWEHTKYYEKEMGEGLKRKFIFFENLIHPGAIADIKLKTMELENRHLNDKGGRQINLDPGYLDAAKIVLASTKDFSHRIYLDNGIYGEVTLMYSGKDYQTLPYTFPDYKTKEYWDIFKTARELFKTEMKKRSSPAQ